MSDGVDDQSRSPFRKKVHQQRTVRPMGMILIGLIVVVTSVLLSRSFLSPTESPPVPHPSSASTAPHPITGDLRVRQGIAHCLNRAELIRTVYPWLEDTRPFEMTSFVPAGHWAYPHDASGLTRYTFDPVKGRALFEEAGWRLVEGAAYRTNAKGQTMRLTLTASEADFRTAWIAIFKEQMKDCGLLIEHRRIPGEWRSEEALKRRDFELVAHTWLSPTDSNRLTFFQCDQIPSPEHNWQGDNFTGWCNPRANEAIRLVTSVHSRETRRTAYRIIQEEYTRDLPSLPLFNRVLAYASNPALQNFNPDPTETLYTWNIAQWVIPGKDTIVIAQRSEPTSLSVLTDDSYITRLIGALVFGVDTTSLGYDNQPLTLKQIPSIENGAIQINVVRVGEGEHIVDANGNAVELQAGVRIIDAQGNEIPYRGGIVDMTQLIVRYEFVEGLKWSDGAPVSRSDYALSYRIQCNLDTVAETFRLPCEKMHDVDFVSDTAYVVTWKPGYLGQTKPDSTEHPYFLPPIGRQPSHQTLSNGQRLADAPISYWNWLPEVHQQPLGIGPYVVSHWEPGREIVFTANPYYYKGSPATPRIIVRFLAPEQAIEALRRGEVDVVDEDTLPPDTIGDLVKAQADLRVRFHFVPSPSAEFLAFVLDAQ